MALDFPCLFGTMLSKITERLAFLSILIAAPLHAAPRDDSAEPFVETTKSLVSRCFNPYNTTSRLGIRSLTVGNEVELEAHKLSCHVSPELA
jgi:hypothetical protein